MRWSVGSGSGSGGWSFGEAGGREERWRRHVRSGAYPSWDALRGTLMMRLRLNSILLMMVVYLLDKYENEVDYAGQDVDAEYGEEEGPLPPGIYLALFDFEPEGIVEMALVEGQEVRVVGRGGGVEWAVVISEGLNAAAVGVSEKGGEGAEKYMLMLESYLKFVRGDEEDGKERNENE
ncbi:hypothetical protein M422DRAFT_255308 [Sphaerobolus stellatus SS14]|uniref:SH3 domain-containing protein n=1 Tax=Sphaerobolus stellatus (strain SS14) TaxID=990650 RepID=A0A0C9UF93_SPHS4|nr:hypothetical protein M422DRAFT_255308 [Sphaerobolus stellatus SS14]